MPVYVDDMRAAFGRMVMCHMVAGTLDELHALATLRYRAVEACARGGCGRAGNQAARGLAGGAAVPLGDERWL